MEEKDRKEGETDTTWEGLDLPMLVGRVMKGALSQGAQADSRIGEARKQFFLEPQTRCSHVDTLILTQ